MAVTGDPVPRWDWLAIRAGGLLALLPAIPLWALSSWAAGRDQRGLALTLSLGALVAFTAGATCAAWLQRLRLPLAHALVTSIGTYLAVQVVVTVYRLATGSTVNWFNVMFFITLAAGAGLIGGVSGQRLRRAGYVPSHERRVDLDPGGDRGDDRDLDPGGGGREHGGSGGPT